jgi:hypothetical protein
VTAVSFPESGHREQQSDLQAKVHPHSKPFLLSVLHRRHGRKPLPKLKKLRNRKSKYRKEMPVHYISPEDADKYKEFLKGIAPETGESR